MPIYEYECDDCKEWTEVMCPVEDMPKSTECSTCGKDAYRRIKSVPSVAISLQHQAAPKIKYRVKKT